MFISSREESQRSYGSEIGRQRQEAACRTRHSWHNMDSRKMQNNWHSGALRFILQPRRVSPTQGQGNSSEWKQISDGCKISKILWRHNIKHFFTSMKHSIWIKSPSHQFGKGCSVLYKRWHSEWRAWFSGRKHWRKTLPWCFQVKSTEQFLWMQDQLARFPRMLSWLERSDKDVAFWIAPGPL